VLSFVSLWSDTDEKIKRIADEWMRRAILEGKIESDYDLFIYNAICVLAALALIAGWIVQAHLTVFAFRTVMFWLFF
jgi:hypothetical protein